MEKIMPTCDDAECCGGQEAGGLGEKRLTARALPMTGPCLASVEVGAVMEILQADDPKEAAVWAQLCLAAKQARALLGDAEA
jgi:hypothetical protein